MDARVIFRSQAAGHDLFLAEDEAVIAIRGAAAPLKPHVDDDDPDDDHGECNGDDHDGRD